MQHAAEVGDLLVVVVLGLALGVAVERVAGGGGQTQRTRQHLRHHRVVRHQLAQ